jgi:hypothetical protein
MKHLFTTLLAIATSITAANAFTVVNGSFEDTSATYVNEPDGDLMNGATTV